MVHRGPAVALVAALGLVLALMPVAGLGLTGLVVGSACAAVLFVLVTDGLAAYGRVSPGPADRVTLVRAVLSCGVAALVADAAARDAAAHVGAASRTAIVALAAVGLSLDAADGHVARRTGTVSSFGGRFDMESDAFLILVLAVQVAGDLGWWVLAIGAARYLLLAAQRFAPWLRASAPPRRWRKAVAAYQGVGLTAAASGRLPAPVAVAVVGLGLAALVASFGTEAATLWRLRDSGETSGAEPPTVRAGSAVTLTMSDARVLVAQRRSG